MNAKTIFVYVCCNILTNKVLEVLKQISKRNTCFCKNRTVYENIIIASSDKAVKI